MVSEEYYARSGAYNARFLFFFLYPYSHRAHKTHFMDLPQMLSAHAGSNNSPTAPPTLPKPAAWGKHCNMIPLLKNLAEFVLTQRQKGALDYISTAPTPPHSLVEY